jgi:hypothetical protein
MDHNQHGTRIGLRPRCKPPAAVRSLQMHLADVSAAAGVLNLPRHAEGGGQVVPELPQRSTHRCKSVA